MPWVMREWSAAREDEDETRWVKDSAAVVIARVRTYCPATTSAAPAIGKV